MWMALGSHVEPVYPPTSGYGFGDRQLSNIDYVDGVSDPNDANNDLTPIADRYPQVLVPAKAGDVVFFHSHVLHRSKLNYTTDRFRRSFVSHYCNARSFTQWGADGGFDDVHAAHYQDPITKMTNGSHILARGDTHLPFARPRFGTPCAALLTPEERKSQSEYAAAAMGNMDEGTMDMMPTDPNVDHDHDEKPTRNGY